MRSASCPDAGKKKEKKTGSLSSKVCTGVLNIMLHDGILDSYKYVTSEEQADKITQGTGVTVKKGYMLRYPYYDKKYTVTLNEDGISGTITVTDKSFGDEEVNTYVFSELTSDSVLIDFSGAFPVGL